MKQAYPARVQAAEVESLPWPLAGAVLPAIPYSCHMHWCPYCNLSGQPRQHHLVLLAQQNDCGRHRVPTSSMLVGTGAPLKILWNGSCDPCQAMYVPSEFSTHHLTMISPTWLARSHILYVSANKPSLATAAPVANYVGEAIQGVKQPGMNTRSNGKTSSQIPTPRL